MGIAEAVSLGSHDIETKVGGILVKKDAATIVATGYNGFVRGAPDNELPATRPEKYAYMVHCEENLIVDPIQQFLKQNDNRLIPGHTKKKSTH